MDLSEICFVLTLVLWLCGRPILGQAGPLKPSNEDLACFKYDSSCNDCIRNPNCQWCSKFVGGDDYHCFARSTNILGNCRKDDIHSPQNNFRLLTNLPLTEFIADKTKRKERTNVVQLKPQKIKLKLRKNEPYTFELTHRQLEDYPLDLYYLMDLSRSMRSHKDTLALLGNQLAKNMRKLTTRFRLGFGTFVDKVLLPFVNTLPSKLENPCNDAVCETPYSYKNNLKLTENDEKFKRKVREAIMSTNLDSPEGGFDGLVQAMVCGEEIGWSKHVRKIIVFSTDGTFHMAGDGKLAGVVKPNDAQCRMSNGHYTGYDQFDYPSVGQLNELAQKEGVNIIFAVKSHANLYKELSRSIDGSHYAPLSVSRHSDTSIVEIVEEVYKNITGRVEVKQSSDTLDKHVRVTVESNCNRDGVTFQPEDFCEGVQEGHDLVFKISVELIECPESMTDRSRVIKVGTLQETVEIEIEMNCDCNCKIGFGSGADRSDCSNAGEKQCGVCICGDGAFGKRCQCQTGVSRNATSSKSDVNKCKDIASVGDTAQVCSGQGRCECEICDCNKDHGGKYCECNKALCRHKPDADVLCSDHGRCECDKCKCDKGWEGDFCQCPDDNACIQPGSKEKCSGNGQCKCGVCLCSQDVIPYSGEFCEECPSCDNGRCDEFRHCVQCKHWKTGILNEEECEKNCTLTVHPVPSLLSAEEEHASLCTYLDEEARCDFSFSYKFISKDNYQIFVKDKRDCPEPINFLAITSGVVAAVVAIGIITLLIWKVVTTIHDRREYSRFMDELKNVKWESGTNPLHVEPSITTSNPVFKQSMSM